MTPNQPQQQQATGTVVDLVAEYRSGKAEQTQFAGDKGTRTTNRAIHRLEVAEQAVEWSQILPDSMPIAAWQPPAPKGSMVNVRLAIMPASVVNAKGMPAKGLYRLRVIDIQPASQPAKK